jgi:hypothetical protein
MTCAQPIALVRGRLAGGRYFWVAALCLLALLAGTTISAARSESQTVDESVHLAAGYSYLKTGDFRLNPEHPPVSKLICGLPLLLLNPWLPLSDISWQATRQYPFGAQFLYHNRLSAGTLLFAGRLGTIALTVGFAGFLALWLRRRFGAAAALFGLALFVLDPNINAHGRYITTDMAITAFSFFTCIAWAEFLEAPSRWRLLLSGLSLGLAMGSKHSAVLVFPILFAIAVVALVQRRPGLSLRRLVGAMALSVVIAFGVVFLSYGAAIKPLVTDRLVAERLAPSLAAEPPAPAAGGLGGSAVKVQPLLHSFRGGTARRAIAWLANVPLPAPYYPIGLYKVAEHSSSGHAAGGGHTPYLLGKRSQKGWWYFFPVVFLVKTPSAVLALLLFGGLGAIVWLVRGMLRGGFLLHFLRQVPLVYAALAIAPLGWMAMSCASSIDIGLRHILPVYPFLYVLAAALMFPIGRASFRHRGVAAAAVLVLVAAESWSVYPHHVAFFNTVAGGPVSGPRYLLDSNIDWGQDLLHLKTFASRHNAQPLCLSYWGTATPEYYNIAYRPLPEVRTPQQRQALDCTAAVSVELLYGEDQRYSALRDLRPDERIGYSIYVYDLRKRRPGGL